MPLKMPVEVNLTTTKKKLPLVLDALSAVMALVGGQASLDPPVPPSRRPRAARGAPVRGAGAKASPARPGRSRRAAEGQATASPETAALIRDLRTKAGLSQKDLADKAGVSQNQISLLETGKQHLKPALAKKLGRLFKTPITAGN